MSKEITSKTGIYPNQSPSELARDLIANIETMPPGTEMTLNVEKGAGIYVNWEMKTNNPDHQLSGACRREFHAMKVPVEHSKVVRKILEMREEQREALKQFILSL